MHSSMMRTARRLTKLEGGVCLEGETPTPQADPPLGTVNQRAVRTLLECILVLQ